MPSASDLLLARRYRLESRIAVGGYGEVWRATDVVLSRPVAIKLLQAGLAQHPETLARFRAEAKNAAALSHENIARVYDYGEPEPPYPPFLVMELVDGPSLAGLLARGPLGPVRTMDIVAQTALGLHAAHQAGLVHRDIKSGNLLLSPGGLVKITDFGISYAAGSAPVTNTGVLLGTPAYLAPERAWGSRATAASDLYSLGVVAYECLAGSAPFAGIAVEIALAHRDRSMPPLPPGTPAGVTALVADLTAKDPAARPAGAADVAQRAAWLRDHLAADGGTQAAPAAPPVPAPTVVLTPVPRPGGGRTARRGGGRLARWGVIAAVAAAAVTGLVLALVTGLGPPAHPAAAPSSTPPAPSSPASSPPVRTVSLNGGSLTGQPVAAVVARLRQLGLRVRVTWQASDEQAPGTVLSVSPQGELRTGTTVTVTGALRPPVPRDKHHGHGKGHGHGD